MYYFICPSFLNTSIQSWATTQHKSLDNRIFDRDDGILENKSVFSPMVLQNPVTSTSSEDSNSRHSIISCKIEKAILPEKNKAHDDDYNPYCQTSKKSKKSKQLLNRNVVPNIIRLVLSFIQKPGKSLKLVESSLKKQNCQTASVKRFFHFQKLVKGKMDNYVNMETLGELVRLRSENFQVYCYQEQFCYRRITRKLVLFFLQHEALNCVLTSKRMEQAKKKEHVVATRNIIEHLKIVFVQRCQH